MSASVGARFFARRALALMIWPDWQYPHCGTSCRIQAACTAFPARVAPIPSTVVTFLPAAADTGVEQERTGCPSRCTVHAPHWAIPQPNLVPVRWSESRSTHKRGVSGAASTLRGLPLTMKETMKAPLGKTMDLTLNLIPADLGSPSTRPVLDPFPTGDEFKHFKILFPPIRIVGNSLPRGATLGENAQPAHEVGAAPPWGKMRHHD